MKVFNKRILASLAFFSATVFFCFYLREINAIPVYAGERIIYAIRPMGRAEYHDLGMVELQGREVRLVSFRTKMPGLDDTEKIYTDGKANLPLRVERSVIMGLNKEYLVEEYDQANFVLTVKKFRNNRKIKDYSFKKDGPIHNAVLLPFYLRGVPKLDIGWTLKARFAENFSIKLVSIDQIKVPAGKFTAYHFTSVPRKFEIWISQDERRLPLKIKGVGGFEYAFVMQERSLQ